MRKLILTVAALALAAPAFAQQTGEKPQDRPARQLTGPNIEAIREAVNTVKADGECMVEFTVTVEGGIKDLKPECDNEEYVPYVLRAMESVTYEPEIFAGEVFDTEGVKQPFKFTRGATSTEKQPVQTKGLEPRDVQRALQRVGGAGTCQAEFLVGLDGKPKNIEPNCTPDKFNPHIKTAIEAMRYTPGEKDGKAIESKVTLPLNLGAAGGG